MIDIYVDIAKIFNNRSKKHVMLKFILKLASKNLFNKIHIGLLANEHYERLTPEQLALVPELHFFINNSTLGDEHVLTLKKTLRFLIVNNNISDKSIEQLNLDILYFNDKDSTHVQTSKITAASIVKNKNISLLCVNSNIKSDDIKGLALRGMDFPRYYYSFDNIEKIPNSVIFLHISYHTYHDQSLIKDKMHKLYRLSIPSGHCDFNYEYPYIHQFNIGISAIEDIDIVNSRKDYLKKLKLNQLTLRALSNERIHITKEMMLKLLDNFNTNYINYIYISINDVDVYRCNNHIGCKLKIDG